MYTLSTPLGGSVTKDPCNERAQLKMTLITEGISTVQKEEVIITQGARKKRPLSFKGSVKNNNRTGVTTVHF